MRPEQSTTEVGYQQIEQTGEFCCGRREALRLLWTGEQLQTTFALGHQTLEQGSIQPMQVLQGVDHPESGPHIQMESGMPQRCKIYNQNAALGFLERDSGVDSNCGTARSSFRIHHIEDASPARGGPAFAARCGDPRERLDEHFGGCVAF